MAVDAAWATSACRAAARRSMGAPSRCSIPSTGGRPRITTSPRGTEIDIRTAAAVRMAAPPEVRMATAIRVCTAAVASELATLTIWPAGGAVAMPWWSVTRSTRRSRRVWADSSNERVRMRSANRHAKERPANTAAGTTNQRPSAAASEVTTARSITVPATTGTISSPTWWETNRTVDRINGRREPARIDRRRSLGVTGLPGV